MKHTTSEIKTRRIKDLFKKKPVDDSIETKAPPSVIRNKKKKPNWRIPDVPAARCHCYDRSWPGGGSPMQYMNYLLRDDGDGTATVQYFYICQYCLKKKTVELKIYGG
jgi:hypothetical protein